ncbi:hypothetical protein A3O05_05385 [Mycobacteroides abscessus]|nr:hypothetical protein A3O05_05385 [Mycobacteroides abscessus]
MLSTGSPVLNKVHSDRSANRSSADREKRCANSSWSAPVKWITTDFATRIASILDDVLVILNETNGGFSDRDAKEVAVKPTGPFGDVMVTITTPAG